MLGHGVFGPLSGQVANTMKQSWDERYAEPGYLFGTEPSAFLMAQKALLKPGMKALAVGDGEGRNGVWLAEQGLDVLSVDVSARAQKKARRLAASRGVTLRLERHDLLTWDWPQRAFDLVVDIFVHFPPEQRRRLHRALYGAVRPGGLLLMEVFHVEQLQLGTAGPKDPAMLYTTEQLAEEFQNTEILVLTDSTTRVCENGRIIGEGKAVHLLARRPLD